MKNKNLSWAGALFVFALLLWCTAVTPGKVADPATYTCAVYSTFFSLLPPVIAIVLALNTKEVYIKETKRLIRESQKRAKYERHNFFDLDQGFYCFQ